MRILIEVELSLAFVDVHLRVAAFCLRLNSTVFSDLMSFVHFQDSPLKSKVAKFNQQVSEHKSNQLENPFSGHHDSRSRSPKHTLKPEDYGK